MKHAQIKFHADTTSNSQVFMSKKSQNLSLGQNSSSSQIFLAAQLFFLVWYFIEAVATDVDVLLPV